MLWMRSKRETSDFSFVSSYSVYWVGCIHCCTLFAGTDVGARGIDIRELPYVINMTLPDESEQYIHRVGRVGMQAFRVFVWGISNDAARRPSRSHGIGHFAGGS